MTKLTDNMIGQLQLNFLSDYERLKSQGKSHKEIYEHLHYRLDYNLYHNKASALYDLDDDPYEVQTSEKRKAYIALYTFLAACPRPLPSQRYEPDPVYRPIIKT